MSEDTKGKNQVEKSSDSSKSPAIDLNTLCPVCLNPITNRSVLDTCLHEFCYECISSWSQQHNHCPTCRAPYHYVMHNIISDNQFEMLPVQPEPVQPLTGVSDNPILRMFIFIQLAAMRQNLVTQRATLDHRISNLRNSLDEAVKNNNTEQKQLLRNELELAENQLNELNNNMNRIVTTVRGLLGREQRAFDHFERQLLETEDTQRNDYNSPPNHANNGNDSNASSNNDSLEVMIGNSPRNSVDNGTSESTISIDSNTELVTSERTNEQSDVVARNDLSKSNQTEKRPQREQ